MPSSTAYQRLWLIIVLCTLPCSSRAYGDFSADLKAASETLDKVLPEAESQMAEGKVDAANAVVLAAFPENSRTAAQAFGLGNILFHIDPKTSYTLHQFAATHLPDEPRAQLEWAMEQHRAGEYAAAATTYAKFAKASPNSASAYGMMAECLMRTGKVQEAVTAWQQSERATDGTLEDLESWVCDVHDHRYPQRQRGDLLSKAHKGDIDAAGQLIALDTAFPRDWWNNGPQVDYLKRDLAVLRDIKFNAPQIAEILCAGDCAVAADAGEPVDNILSKAGFLLDEKATLPQSGGMLSIMLNSAFSSKAITKDKARDKWGPALLEKIKTSTDAELINVAANLYVGTPQLAQVDSRGWDAAADERFAASLLLSLDGTGELKLTDPRLVKAVKQFPDSATIAGIVVRLSAQEHQPLQPPLIAAIEAEYAHFSPDPITLQPSAKTLRQYFLMLAKELPAH